MLKFEKKPRNSRDCKLFLAKNNPTWVHLGFKKHSNESNLSHNKSNTFIMNLHPKKLFPEIDNYELLNHQVVTKRDLLNFGNALLHEIQSGKSAPEQPAQWLKSSEVRKLLKISPGTLQNLRINGTLNFNRIGGIMYYKYEDLRKLLEK
jgi:hypothetical protein